MNLGLSDAEMTALATPATVTEGEITVASKDELHAASLSGKRLLAPVERGLTGSPSARAPRRKLNNRRCACLDAGGGCGPGIGWSTQ
jgi:hypothetical protein